MTSTMPRSRRAATSISHASAAGRTSASCPSASVTSAASIGAVKAASDSSSSTSVNQSSTQVTYRSRIWSPRRTSRWTGSASRYSFATTAPVTGASSGPDAVPAVDRLPHERLSARLDPSATWPPATVRAKDPRPAPHSWTTKACGLSIRRQTSVSRRPMHRPKNGWSSGAVRKSPERVGRSSDVA